MKTKGESAADYLITWGWAILVVIIVGVILWQMKPAQAIPQEGKWECDKLFFSNESMTNLRALAIYDIMPICDPDKISEYYCCHIDDEVGYFHDDVLRRMMVEDSAEAREFASINRTVIGLEEFGEYMKPKYEEVCVSWTNSSPDLIDGSITWISWWRDESDLWQPNNSTELDEILDVLISAEKSDDWTEFEDVTNEFREYGMWGKGEAIYEFTTTLEVYKQITRIHSSHWRNPFDLLAEIYIREDVYQEMVCNKTETQEREIKPFTTIRSLL